MSTFRTFFALLLLTAAVWGQGLTGDVTTGTHHALRDEFKRVFKAGEAIHGKNFTLTPYDGNPGATNETWFTIQFSDPQINYAVLEVFYITPPSTVSYLPDLLVHKTISEPVFYDAITGTGIVSVALYEIRMIRVTGLHVESREDIR